MKSSKFPAQFAQIYELALRLAESTEADAILVLLEHPTEWEKLKEGITDKRKVVVAADRLDQVVGASDAGLAVVINDMAEDSPVNEKISHSLLECVAQEILPPGGKVIAVYSGFEPDDIDTISVIRLDDRLGRLTVRDLRQLATQVPLETLKTVVDLAIEIGREGREGKPIGTMFVVGNARRLLAHSRPAGFDPVKGYNRKERNLFDARVREGMKEIAQLDGAFIVSPDGTVEAAARLVDSNPTNIVLSKGLGSRHWAAAAISKTTNCVAVVVSQSNGTVRIFQNGEIMLRIEPFRRAMKWRDFDFDPPEPDKEE